jgi:hypothetical protein
MLRNATHGPPTYRLEGATLWEMGLRLGTWNVRGFYGPGSLQRIGELEFKM